MEPVKSNTNSKKCGNPVSANCVTWPLDATIPCIPECNGDSVTNIVTKIGQQICYTQSLLDLSQLNLSCLYTPCPSCPKQPTSIEAVFQILTNVICQQATQIASLQTTVNELVAGVNPTP